MFLFSVPAIPACIGDGGGGAGSGAALSNRASAIGSYCG